MVCAFTWRVQCARKRHVDGGNCQLVASQQSAVCTLHTAQVRLVARESCPWHECECRTRNTVHCISLHFLRLHFPPCAVVTSWTSRRTIAAACCASRRWTTTAARATWSSSSRWPPSSSSRAISTSFCRSTRPTRVRVCSRERFVQRARLSWTWRRPADGLLRG